MELKKIIGIVIIAILITGIFASTSPKGANAKARTLHSETIKKSIETPQENNNASIAIHENQDTSITPRISLDELAGHINKEYGIREDILRYIEKEIPRTNKQAFDAAIKLAADSHFIYYKATKEEALQRVKRTFIATHCFNQSLSRIEAHRIYQGINKMMRDTPEREQHIWHIDESYFGWKMVGFGNTSSDELKQMCETGNY